MEPQLEAPAGDGYVQRRKKPERWGVPVKRTTGTRVLSREAPVSRGAIKDYFFS